MADHSANNKRIAKNTMMLYVRMLVLMLLGFYTSRVVLNSLGVVDYGVYNVVGGIVSIFSILTTALSGTTQRFITIALGKNDLNKLKDTFSVGFSIHLIISFFVLICIEIVGLYYLYNYAVIPDDRMAAAFWVFQISVLTAILSIINVPFHGTIIAHEKMSVFAFFSIIDIVVKLLICFALPYTVYDKLILYAILMCISSVFNFLCMQIYCVRNFVEVRYKLSWNKQMLSSMFGMTAWSFFDKIVYVGSVQGIVLLTNYFFGPIVNAALSIVTQGCNAVNQFVQNFQVAINPQITKSYSKGELENMHKLVIRSAKYSCFLLLYFVNPAFFCAETMLKVWLENVPQHAVLYFKLSLVLSLINAIINPLQVSNMACGKVKKYFIVRDSILLLVLPLTYYVYEKGGAPEFSVIVNIVLSTIVMLVGLKVLQSQIDLSFFSFFNEVIIKVVLTTILSVFFTLLFFEFCSANEYLKMIMTLIFATIATSLCVFVIGLNYKEKQFLCDYINRFFRKKHHKNKT